MDTNTSTNCGFPDYIRRRHFSGKGRSTELQKSAYSIVAKPWNLHISIHLFAPIDKLKANHTFKYPRLWLSKNPRIRVTTSDLHIHIVKNLSAYGITQIHQLVETVLSPRFEDLSQDCQVKNDLAYLFDMNRIRLLTPIPMLQANQKLTINVLFDPLKDYFMIEILVVLCDYIGKLESKNAYQTIQMSMFLLEVLLSQVGNYTLRLVMEENVFMHNFNRVGSIKFCKSFHGNGSNAIAKNWEASSAFVELLFNSTLTGFLPGYICIQKPDMDLRFVSCGPHVYSKLAFYELHRAFDGYIWMFIIASFTSVILVTKHIRKSLNMADFVLKAIFEQGNPLSNRLLKHNFTAIVGVVTMLVGTVVANAYKNTNMYHMVLPMAPLRRQYFEQLYHENFVIYTRFDTIAFSSPQFEFDVKRFHEEYVSTYLNATAQSFATCFKTKMQQISESCLEDLK